MEKISVEALKKKVEASPILQCNMGSVAYVLKLIHEVEMEEEKVGL